MKDIRLMQMERYLSEVGYATIQQLCEKFEIHPNTARSDICLLYTSICRSRSWRPRAV